jgi:hypothetical protein
MHSHPDLKNCVAKHVKAQLRRLIWLSCAVIAAPASANERPDTQAYALIEPVLNPATHSFRIAVTLKPKSGWHLYWENPGDAGEPFSAQIEGLPPGSKIGAWQHPLPVRVNFYNIISFVHPKAVTLISSISLPKSAKHAPQSLKLAAQWLACSESSCVPEQRLFIVKAVPSESRAKTIEYLNALELKLPEHSTLNGAYTRSGNEINAFIPLSEKQWLKSSTPTALPATRGVYDNRLPLKVMRNKQFLIISGQAAAEATTDDFEIVLSSQSQKKPQRVRFKSIKHPN